MRLGVFGGTFNPIHFGHLRAVEEVRERLELDSVLFVPSGSPPLKSEGLADIEHRFLMASMAIATNEHFSISDMECRRPDRSYTVTTAMALKDEYPDASICFILGIDAFLDIPHWREPEKLVSLVDFAVLSRPPHKFAELAGSQFISARSGMLDTLDNGTARGLTVELKGGRTAELLSLAPQDISSTDIRMRLAEGRSIKYLLPERVESFIMSNGLYTGK